MEHGFLQRLTSRTRDRRANIQLGVLLAFIAGTVNAGGFLAVGHYTSHMTGIVSSIPDFLVLHRYDAALSSLFFLVAFIGGAMLTSFLVNLARSRDLGSEYAGVLMLESLLLMVFGLSFSSVVEWQIASVTQTVSLLCFIMGMQNAIITKISNAEIRTTHVTGMATDIGIELGRYVFLTASRRANYAIHSRRLLLHSGLLSAFLAGGVAGAYSFTYIGFVAMLPLALSLAVISALPLWEDIRRKT